MAACLTGLLLCACSLMGSRSADAPGAVAVTSRLAAEVASAADGRSVVVRGLRHVDGTSSSSSRALGELLESALLRAGVRLDPMSLEERDQLRWQAGALLPSGWRRDALPLSLGGQLRPDGRLTHLRLLLGDSVDGTALWSGRAGLSSDNLDQVSRAYEARTRPSEEEVALAPADPDLALELHVIARRDEEGFARGVDIGEGAVLRQGDRLQIRFRTKSDCQVYAFLFGSKGERSEVFAPELVYAGRMQYGPSQEGFVSLREADRVHTLYVLAAARLEGLGELFEDLDDLVQRSQIDRYLGLEKADAAIVSFVERRVEGTAVPVVQRGREGIDTGDSERWVYGDGQVLSTRPEMLGSRRALVRAISFEVTYAP